MAHELKLPKRGKKPIQVSLDVYILFATFCLAGIGLIMVASSSMGIAEKRLGDPFYYFWQQLFCILLGLMAGVGSGLLSLASWRRLSQPLLIFGVILLGLVLIPGVGRSVNGSTRWLNLGPFSFQVSEAAKFAFIVYLANYMVRHGEELRRHWRGVVKPLCIMGVLTLLLLLEPDFGAAVVLMSTAMAMLFLGGVPLSLFITLMALALGAFGILAVSAPYRLMRLTSFLDPWADQFDTGYQLTQALIAFGRGEWFGVGLGAGVQKLFYLPEAHTDFLFAILAEELGLVGALTVLSLFALFVYRGLKIGLRAHRQDNYFGAYLAYGITLWIGMQALINIGVNAGVLPTKGLTLPFMSYGRSSIIVIMAAVGLLLRVDFETRRLETPIQKRVRP